MAKDKQDDKFWLGFAHRPREAFILCQGPEGLTSACLKKCEPDTFMLQAFRMKIYFCLCGNFQEN